MLGSMPKSCFRKQPFTSCPKDIPQWLESNPPTTCSNRRAKEQYCHIHNGKLGPLSYASWWVMTWTIAAKRQHLNYAASSLQQGIWPTKARLGSPPQRRCKGIVRGSRKKWLSWQFQLAECGPYGQDPGISGRQAGHVVFLSKKRWSQLPWLQKGTG